MIHSVLQHPRTGGHGHLQCFCSSHHPMQRHKRGRAVVPYMLSSAAGPWLPLWLWTGRYRRSTGIGRTDTRTGTCPGQSWTRQAVQVLCWWGRGRGRCVDPVLSAMWIICSILSHLHPVFRQVDLVTCFHFFFPPRPYISWWIASGQSTVVNHYLIEIEILIYMYFTSRWLALSLCQ